MPWQCASSWQRARTRSQLLVRNPSGGFVGRSVTHQKDAASLFHYLGRYKKRLLPSGGIVGHEIVFIKETVKLIIKMLLLLNVQPHIYHYS